MFRSCRIGFAFVLFLAAPAAPASGVSVLFVGNSLTYTNDLPTVFKKFAAESPLRLGAELAAALTAPGARGRFLWWQAQTLLKTPLLLLSGTVYWFFGSGWLLARFMSVSSW